MRGAALALVTLLIALSACSTPEPPAPIALSYPYDPPQGLDTDRYHSLARTVAGAYVQVLVYEKGGGSDAPGRAVVNGASGTIVDDRGLVVTAAHIAKDRRFAAEVTTADGKVHQATILDVAPARELALLKIAPGPGVEAPERADPESLRAGQPVVAIGTPDNVPGVVSFGRILNPRRTDRIAYAEYGFDDAIELAMEIEPGHSGGPVFDAEGRLIGVLASFGLGDTRRVPYVSTRLAYAIPITAVASYLNDVATY